MDLTVTIRDADLPTLTSMAEDQWRNLEQQASAMLEQALHAQRSKSDPSIPRRTRRARVNGVTHTLATAQ